MAARTIHRKLLLQLSAGAVVMFAFAIFVFRHCMIFFVK